MKPFQILALAAAVLLSSCLKKEPASPEPAPVAKPDPRPDRAPPPPQPQDGSFIVTPDGTSTIKVPNADDVSEEDKNDALKAAEREIVRRKNDAAEADDSVSKALQKISEDDLEKAFSELKKAVDKYPKTAE